MSRQAINIKAKDGYPIGAVHFMPPQGTQPLGQIVICSATGVLQGFYADVASFLAERGFDVYTFDYRGIGASREGSLKGFSASLNDWAEDIIAVATYAKAQKELPLFALAHSIGGQLLTLSSESSLWDGITTVASQSGYWKKFAGKYQFKMWLFWHILLPMAKWVGYFPAKRLGLFEDLPQAVSKQWCVWGKHPDYLKHEFPNAFNDITCPVRVYGIEDDYEFAPKKAVDWFAQQFVNAAVTRIHIVPENFGLEKLEHFNFFRKSMRSIFWNDLALFFEKESNKRLIKL